MSDTEIFEFDDLITDDDVPKTQDLNGNVPIEGTSTGAPAHPKKKYNQNKFRTVDLGLEKICNKNIY